MRPWMTRQTREGSSSRRGCLFLVVLLVMWVGAGCGMLEEDDKEATEAPPDSGGWAAEVIDVTYGEDAGFGQGLMPGVVLGPPKGGGSYMGSLDVLSLGVGGSITLGFGQDACVVNGVGDDLVVLENVFYVAGDGSNRFIETARVAVSQDGKDFVEFPTEVDESLPPGDPERYSGFAGVEPVVDGDSPATDGGDRFDLDQVGLPWIRYVRITDTAGDPWDAGDEFGMGYGKAGFDLDAVGAIHFGTGEACR